MIQRFVEVNGLRYAVADWEGYGRPILLLHGNGFHGRVWDPVASDLLPSYRPLAVDWRGHGDSAAADRYASADFVDDLVALVDALGLADPLVVAHSVGAIAALAVAGSAGTLGPIVAVEPIIRARGTPPSQFTQQMVDGALRRREVWPSREAVRESYAPRRPFVGWDPAVLDAYISYGFADQPDGSVRLKCAAVIEAEVFRHGVVPDPWPLFPAITVPVLLLRAERSEILRADVIQDAAATIPHVVWREIAGASHSLPMEQPHDIAAIARTFFNSLPA